MIPPKKERKRKRQPPTYNQWKDIRFILGNGWGDGDITDDPEMRRRYARSIQAFEDWFESHFDIKFKNRLC